MSECLGRKEEVRIVGRQILGEAISNKAYKFIHTE